MSTKSPSSPRNENCCFVEVNRSRPSSIVASHPPPSFAGFLFSKIHRRISQRREGISCKISSGPFILLLLLLLADVREDDILLALDGAEVPWLALLDGAEIAWLGLLDGAEVTRLALLDGAEVAWLRAHDAAKVAWLRHFWSLGWGWFGFEFELDVNESYL